MSEEAQVTNSEEANAEQPEKKKRKPRTVTEEGMAIAALKEFRLHSKRVAAEDSRHTSRLEALAKERETLEAKFRDMPEGARRIFDTLKNQA